MVQFFVSHHFFSFDMDEFSSLDKRILAGLRACLPRSYPAYDSSSYYNITHTKTKQKKKVHDLSIPPQPSPSRTFLFKQSIRRRMRGVVRKAKGSRKSKGVSDIFLIVIEVRAREKEQRSDQAGGPGHFIFSFGDSTSLIKPTTAEGGQD